MIPPLGLRFRLALWYSFVFACAFILLGCASLWMVHRAVDELEQNELHQRVRSVQRYLEARPAGEPLDHLRDAITAAYDVSHGNKWLQVIDEHGNWIYRSPHVIAAFPRLALPSAVHGAGKYFSYTLENIPVSAYISTIEVRGVRYTVQTGLSLTKTLVILTNFSTQLFILTAVGLVLSSLAGYFMSRKALTPIAAIADEARRINDKNLSSRLPELKTRDELASLSNTLNQMLCRIEAGYQSVRAFTANAAHELRSPVALLRAEAEVALALPRDADYYRNTCEHMMQSSMHMSKLIDHLLTLARVDAGVEPLCFEPVNLPDVLSEIAEEWQPLFDEAEIQFSQSTEAEEFWIQADYPSLKRLLHVLLENAWRYTPSGRSVSLALTEIAAWPDTPGSRVPSAVVSVSDTGIGIHEEDQQKIYQRFCRIARPQRGEYSGSGLGLALGLWIAEQHKSTIRLQSKPGEGSCFSMQFQGISIRTFPGHSGGRHGRELEESSAPASLNQPEGSMFPRIPPATAAS